MPRIASSGCVYRIPTRGILRLIAIARLLLLLLLSLFLPLLLLFLLLLLQLLDKLVELGHHVILLIADFLAGSR